MTRGNFEFAAGLSAVAFKSGASTSVGGQKFSFDNGKDQDQAARCRREESQRACRS